MTKKAAIQDFFSQPVLAVAGVSRDPRKFGNLTYRELKAKGRRVLALNPNVQTAEGDPCYPSLKDLPEQVGGLIVVTKPAVTEQLVRDAAESGIRHIWLQSGSETRAAVQFCQEHGMNVIFGECVMMYIPGTAFPHQIHKFVKEVFGGRPN